MLKVLCSGVYRWLLVLLMFLPILITNFIAMGFFAYKDQYFAVFFLIWVTCYLAFWMLFGVAIHVSANEKFSQKHDYFIVVPTFGDPKVIMSGGHEYKKQGSARPQSYIMCDTKSKDIHLTSGIIFSANPTDDELILREIDIMDHIDNKLYMRGFFVYDSHTKTYSNHLDVSSLPAQMSLLSLELKTTLKAKDGLERLYELSHDKLIEERTNSLERESTFTKLFTQTLETSNPVTGKFSGTSTALENRKIDAKMGSDSKVKAMIDERLKELEAKMYAEYSKKNKD